MDILLRESSGVAVADRIARNLHDGPLQDVFATRLRLDALVARVPADIAEELRELSSLQGRIIHRMREVGRGASGIDDERPACDTVVRVIADASIGLGFSPHCDIDPRFDDIEDRNLVNDIVLVVREALSNIARHAGASRAAVHLAFGSGVITLRVTDNGVGLSSSSRRGNGLANLRMRATRHGGSCAFGSGPDGHGTVIDWRVPLRATAGDGVTGTGRHREQGHASSASSRRVATA